MKIQRYQDTEWGCTLRTVVVSGRKEKVAVYWKEIDGQWMEMGAKIPPEVLRFGLKLEKEL